MANQVIPTELFEAKLKRLKKKFRTLEAEMRELTETEDGVDVYLIAMYDKSEESSIKKEVLLKIVKALFGE